MATLGSVTIGVKYEDKYDSLIESARVLCSKLRQLTSIVDTANAYIGISMGMPVIEIHKELEDLENKIKLI